jgi:hypothetical protein
MDVLFMSTNAGNGGVASPDAHKVTCVGLKREEDRNINVFPSVPLRIPKDSASCQVRRMEIFDLYVSCGIRHSSRFHLSVAQRSGELHCGSALSLPLKTTLLF